MTLEEEKKSKKAAYDREYKKRKKEHLSEINKKYREENKEMLKAKGLIYREANRDKLASSSREYYNNNKHKVKERTKRNHNKNKDGYIKVYYLPEEHYVGQTNNMSNRMSWHKNYANRHTLDVEVLGIFETRKEALAFEAKLHDMGYYGNKAIK